MLSDPALGALFGVGFVLVVGVAANRSTAGVQRRRLELIRQKIERRQAQIAATAQESGRDDPSEGIEERIDD